MLAIVIPVFNDMPGLLVSLRSLLVAHYPMPTSLVVVDDGSATPIELPADSIALSPVLVRLEVNQGIEAALNAGLESARHLGAEYVARLDAGDTVTPDRFVRQLQLFDSDPGIGLVGSGARFVDPSGATAFIFCAPSDDLTIRRRMAVSSCILHPTAVMRMSILDAVGDYRCNFPAAEDYELFRRMLVKCRGACISDQLVVILASEQGISVRKRHLQLQSRLRVQIRYFDWWMPSSYLGIIATWILMLLPHSVVAAAKRVLGRSIF